MTNKDDASRIAFIFPAPILGGHELMALHIIEQWASSDDKIVDSYVPESNKRLLDALTDRGIDCYKHSVTHKKLEIVNAFFNPIHILSAFNFLRTIKGKYDRVIIVQGDIELGSVFVVMGRLLDLPIESYIPFTHSFRLMGSKFALIKDLLSKLVYRSCDHYITISKCFSEELIQKNPKAEVDIIENFIEPPKLEEIRTSAVVYNPSHGAFKIFIIGRVNFRQKNHDVLVNALKVLDVDKNIRIELHVVGDGPDLDRLKTMARAIPDNISVIYHGWMNNCWEVAKDADLIVIPSRFEGVPLVMLEAMARKIPILASARDGMKDYLPSDSLYYPVARSDESCILAKKLSKFICDAYQV